jgi:HAD superfamily phosphatase (TIGR01668 family)
LHIPADWLLTHGYRAVLLDLDNTLLPRDCDAIPPDILAWAHGLTAAGLRCCLLSNNWHARVSAAAEELGFALVSKAVKPLPFAFLLALHRLQARRREAVMIGDQLYTDMLGAAVLGIGTIMVQPLSDYDLAHTLFLRKLERFTMGSRVPEPLC